MDHTLAMPEIGSPLPQPTAILLNEGSVVNRNFAIFAGGPEAGAAGQLP
jgi:hypothetical protein